MLTVWIFQALINLLLLVVAVQWMLARKRIARLEAALRRLTIARAGGVASEGAQSLPKKAIQATTAKLQQSAVAVNEAATTEPGTLIERDLAPEQRSASTGEKAPGRLSATELAAAYDYADQLLGRGVSMQDVARKTGLSLAELRLVAKMAGRASL